MGTVNCGPFAGMSTAQAQALLTSAQTAYANLSMGALAETVAYDQGTGSRSVTYTRASMSNLLLLITQLQQALGQAPRRHPIRLRYR